MAYYTFNRALRIHLLPTMQPRSKHPLQRIPTWVALSVGIIIGLFIAKMFSAVSSLSSIETHQDLRSSSRVCKPCLVRDAGFGPATGTLQINQ